MNQKLQQQYKQDTGCKVRETIFELESIDRIEGFLLPEGFDPSKELCVIYNINSLYGGWQINVPDADYMHWLEQQVTELQTQLETVRSTVEN